MKKLQIILLLIFLSTLMHAAWVQIECNASVQAWGRFEFADGNYNIIGSSGTTYDYIEIPSNQNYVNFELVGSLGPLMRLKGYDMGPEPHNCNMTDWKTVTWSGNGQQAFPYYPSDTLFLDLEPYDVKITTYANIERSSTISLTYEGTNTPNGQTPSNPIMVEGTTFSKGWRTYEWDDLLSPSFDGPSSWTVNITEDGVGDETCTTEIVGLDYTGSTLNYWMICPCPEFCFENKPLHAKWNWESFPKLSFNNTSNNYEDDFVPELEDNIDPDGFDWLNLDDDGIDDYDLIYHYLSDWDPESYLLCSTDAVKIQLQMPTNPQQDYRAYIADGTRVSPTTSIDLVAGWNWIGYWLPEGQMCDEAFGDNWDDVHIIKAEDWYYDDQSSGRSFGSSTPISSLPKPFHYGEGYMIKMHEAITLIWESDASRDVYTYNNFNRPEPQYFDYEVKADYEVIDIVDVPQNIAEIGVFLDDICVGAVVVQDSSVQILVYTDDNSRDPSPFNFQIASGRSSGTPILNYEVYNINSGGFEPGVVLSQLQGYSIVKLGEEGEPQNDIPVIDQMKLYGNYPNPFNPETNISFSLSQEQKIELIVYNIKGQKVRQLVNGQFASGKHSVTWDGKDNVGKNVGSGLYFYKLITNNQEISKKMLLLK